MVTVGGTAQTSNGMFYSNDFGLTWTATTGDTIETAPTGYGRGVCWNGYKWLVTGANTPSPARTMLYSYDGIVWTATASSVFLGNSASFGSTVAFNSVRPNQIIIPRNITVAGGSYLGTTTLAVSSSSSISGNTLTVGLHSSGAWQIGQIVIGGTTAANTYIIAFGTGTGTTGTYIVNISQTVAAAALSGVPNSVAYSTASSIAVTTGILTVGGTVAGALYQVGQLLTGTGVPANTYITGYISGTGGAGTYSTNITTAVASTAITGLYATSLAYSTDNGFSWAACGGTYATPGTSTASTITVTTGVLTVGGTVGGIFQVGQLLTGTGVPANTYISGRLTGRGGAGTYSTNTTTAVASTAITSSIPTNSTTYSIATNGSMWLASTQNSATSTFVYSTLSYSFDGINWSVVPNFATNIMGSSAQVRGIAWSPVLKLWVVVGTGSATPAAGSYQLAYSYDGLNWVGVSSVLFGSGANSSVGNCVAWGEDKFVAGGGNSVAAGNRVYYSYDGKTWIVGTPIFATSYSAVAYNGTMWVATGNNANSLSTGLAYSYNGITWVLNPTTTIFTLASNTGAVAWSPALNIWVAGSADTTNTLYYSYNGINWTGCTGSLGSGTTCQTLCWTGNRFIGGWSVAGATQFYTSTNGINWVATGPVMFTSNFSLAWSSYLPNSGEQLTDVAIQEPTLAFGSGVNTIAYSYDGIQWRGVGKTLFTNTGYGGCWNGKIWVAGGTSSEAVFTGSISGSILTITSVSSGSVTAGLSITGTGILPNTFISAGSGLSWTVNLPQNVTSTTITANSGVLGYSYDGINWTPVSQTVLTGIIYNVAWNGTLFVAAGGGNTGYCLAYSYDGINNWTAVANTALSLGMGIGYNIVWGQDKFVATGSRIISATFTGSIPALSSTLTVTGTVIGTIAIGQIVLGANSQTYISAYGTGTGGAGTYTVSNSQASAVNVYGTTGGFIGASGGAASFTGTIAITTGVLTVSSVTGTIAIGQMIIGGTVPAGTYITGGSGTTWTTTLSSNPSSYTCTDTTSGGAAYSSDGINWIALKNAFFYNSTEADIIFYPFGAGIAWGDNRWVYSSGSITGRTFVLYSNTDSITGTFGWVQLNTTSSNYCIRYGIYPITSSTSGTTYSSVFITSNQGSTSGNYYSTNGGVTWSSVTTGLQSYNIVYNGKRFISCNITAGIQYNTIPSSAWTSVTNPTGGQLFSVIRGLATSAWPTLGSVYIDNALTLSSTSGLNTNNQLDIYSDTYFNNGYNNMAATIKATQIP
jgi:hypothetical protein